ncbi:hypothetical protein FHX74_000849 [Friedmanniella endophytica]|uniref:DUF3017 domain-containing protein n=1 Tax=Microlunatus kandeliicorticis TaxID=1759536 RepID=A0A7W3IQB9_9ACTN|nr:DUF3017 domain-containing protein [Microlunatus kandeliicorticis]MBA8793255.1 hypothetical protein [Microlunatus kandeliicorticis]
MTEPDPVALPETEDGRPGVSLGTSDTGPGAGSAAGVPATARRPTYRWPLLVVLAGVAAGLVVVALGAWRLGCVITGAALAIGAVERIALPRRNAGLLRVRSRAFDVLVMLGLAVTIVALAFAVPEGRR